MTIDKLKKPYDNSFLEFYGDGVLSILVAWDLILLKCYEKNDKSQDIDSVRIDKTGSRKLFEVWKDMPIPSRYSPDNLGLRSNGESRDFIDNSVDSLWYLKDYIALPTHKLLEFFIFPQIKYRYNMQVFQYENHANRDEFIDFMLEKFENPSKLDSSTKQTKKESSFDSIETSTIIST